MRIEITEIENHNSYRVWHDAAVLIERTTSPMCAATRVFLARGAAGLDAARMRPDGHAGHHQQYRPLGHRRRSSQCGRF
jgi:hypothetical protein